MNETPDIGKMFSQLTSSIGSSVSEIFTKLKDSSIGEQFQSWIGKGENKPVTADQVTEALGPEAMNKIAEKTGTTPQQAAQSVAQKLPGMVDRITPDGRLPDPVTMRDNLSQPTGIKQNMSKAAKATKGKMTGATGTARSAVPSGMPGNNRPPQS